MPDAGSVSAARAWARVRANESSYPWASSTGRKTSPMWGSSSTKRRCRGEAMGRSRSEEAGDRRPVPAQVEQQPAHVGGGMDEADEQGVRAADRNDGPSPAGVQHGG